MELHSIARFVRRECFSSTDFNECWLGFIPKRYPVPIFVHAAVLSIVAYPILYACFRSPWLGCMPWIGPAFGTPGCHYHLVPLMSLIYRQFQQLFWIVVAKIEEMMFWSPFDSPPFQDAVSSTQLEAGNGSSNPIPQWILPTNHGGSGARRQTQVTRGADEANSEEDDWEEEFWEEGFWEEGIWGEYDSDASDVQSDALVELEHTAGD